MTINNETCLKLVLRVKEGDTEAFEELRLIFLPILKKVYSIQMSSYGKKEFAQHLIHDIVSVFYEIVLRYDSNKNNNFVRYVTCNIFWLVSNLKKKHLFKREVEVYNTDHYGDYALKGLMCDTIEVVDRHILLGDIFFWLFKHLGVETFYIFYLYYRLQMTIKDVANTLDLGSSYVYLRLVKARDKIRIKFNKE